MSIIFPNILRLFGLNILFKIKTKKQKTKEEPNKKKKIKTKKK